MTDAVAALSEQLNDSMAEREEVAPKLPPLELTPGIYRGMPMRDYLRLRYMSASRLERLRRSPLQYQHSLTEENGTSSALERGTALHMAILEPLFLEANYTVAGKCTQPLKSGQRKGEPCGTRGLFNHKEMGWLCGTHAKGCSAGFDYSREILTADDYAAVIGMRDAIMLHPRARTLFEGAGEFETTIIFDDPDTGVRCRSRPDRLVERAGMLVDLKTTRDAAPWAFPRQAESLGYFRKLALYRRGLRAVGWGPYNATAVVAPEAFPPFDLVCYLPEEEDLDSAEQEVVALLRVFKTCEELKQWDGYATEFQPLRRPAWATAGNGELANV